MALALGVRNCYSGTGNNKLHTIKLQNSKLLLFVALWLLTTIISGVNVTNKTAFLFTVVSRAVYAMILLASYYEFSVHPWVLRPITNLYIGVALVVALFGVLQLGGLIPNPLIDPFSGQLIGGGDRSRMASFLSNANLLAGYLSVPFFFSWVQYRKSLGRRRHIYLAIFVALLVSLIFTFSRSGYLGIIAGAIVLYIVRSRENQRKRFIKCIVIAFTAIFLLALFIIVKSPMLQSTSNILSAMVAGDTQELDSSNQNRLMVWNMAIKMYKSSPLIGVGAGQFQVLFENYIPLKYSFLDAFNAHNTYLQILAETGILGLTSFFALFGYIVLMVLKASKKDPSTIEEMGGALAGLITLVVIGLTHNMVKTEIWFIAGLVLAYSRQNQNNKKDPKIHHGGERDHS